MKKRVYLLFTILAAAFGARSAEPACPLLLSWTDIDSLKPAQCLPRTDNLRLTDTLTAWRGETVSARALLGSQAPLRGPVSVAMPGGDASFVGYVLTDDQRSCGAHNFELTPWEVADVIDLPGSAVKLQPGRVQPVWCTINVADDAPAGPADYRLAVTDSCGRELGALTLTVNVQPRQLPPPAQWKFHTDFWQQPYALSRYDSIPRWSDAHFEALKPYMRHLARAGQKVVTAILFYEPWGDQSHDKFDPMVAATRRADGAWAFDYEIFDRYVTMMAECGIDGQINCYSMIPWDMQFRYLDEPTGEFRFLETKTGTPEYNDLWGAFISDFAAHLRAKGWFDRTCIAMDERGLKAMLDAIGLVEQTEPQLKIALAGNYHAELAPTLYDYSVAMRQDFPAGVLAARKAAGQISTLYTCCTDATPNLLTNNEPADAALLPLLADARGLDGYLHWSWMNWPDEPLTDSRFRLFSPGDTYLFYPGPRSSVRFENYIRGVQLVEKMRILREQGVAVPDVSGKSPAEVTRIINNLSN